MFGWLTNLFSNPVSDLKAAWRWITGAITAVYSYFNNLIDQLYNALNWLDSVINRYVNDIWRAITAAWNLLQWVVTVGIPRLAKWAENEIAKAYNYAVGLYHWAVSELQRLEKWALGELDKFYQWVLRNIWDPLWNGLQRIVRWVEHEGAYVYYLLTHPDQLAILLGKYILASWISLASKYGRVVARWVLHNMLNDAKWLANLLEDVISSLL